VAMVAMADTAIDTAPADTLANEAARKLYAYLKDEVWGKRVMAGCQAEWNYNTNDAQRIYQAGASTRRSTYSTSSITTSRG